MKEYICVDDTYKSLDKEEKKVFLKLISKTMHYTKVDICREFWNKIQFYSNCKSSNHLSVAERLLTEMESEE